MGLLKRFVVAERSMAPALVPGDGLLAVPLRRPREGHLVVLPHPDGSGRWLVKRVAALAGARLVVDGRERVVGPDEMWVLSDDRDATEADSRRFGAVPVAGAWRVVLRVPARWTGR